MNTWVMCCRKFLSRSESPCWTESCLKQKKCWHPVEFPHVSRFYGVSCNDWTGKLWPEDVPRLWNCCQVASYIVFFTRSGCVSAKDVQMKSLLCSCSGVTFPTQSFLLCSWIRLNPFCAPQLKVCPPRSNAIKWSRSSWPHVSNSNIAVVT
jgi:hypothetical protein